ncbi:hypothetical protein [Gracilimonas mengyeensis]|uniref:Uncharacterized protein n=1 Tax=Gracilimonas mengyeensis TaxID=1302730 RepID=A0A521FI48_9BACT|nr:hypothetical protein [Gracilimonas mengyeensis]SMO95887.1 hypothetical protein SAMN06265219_11953 [Gracilimonas mengyeensis]
MDINKLNNHINGHVNGTAASDSTERSNQAEAIGKARETSDKVSLTNPSNAKKSEELFAKIELEKLNQSSFDKLKGYKAKLQEYEAAKEQSPEAAAQTEIGKMLNDSDVWGKIAQNIIEK